MLTEESRCVLAWLLDARTRALPVTDFVAALSEQLRAVGVPLWRVNTSLRALHPEVYVRNVTWRRGAGCTVTQRSHALLATSTYLDSPVALLHAGHARVRRKLAGPDADLGFAVCRELAAEGGTDYAAMPLDFGAGQRSFISWATDAPEGFSDAQLALLESLLPALALRIELDSAQFATRSLLEVYLGQNAAERVLAGAVRRGTGELIDAAIWYCDLRGFTDLSDARAPQEVVAALDAYFERVGAAVQGRGGEVLKFVGDAMLAIFAVGGEVSPEAACARALAAAEGALADMRALNAERAGQGLPALEIGVALHLGRVLYGNVGARERLDFTVISASVNEVCRLESLCKPLGTQLVMSSEFARACGDTRAASAGHHQLKGVARAIEVFRLGG